MQGEDRTEDEIEDEMDDLQRKIEALTDEINKEKRQHSDIDLDAGKHKRMMMMTHSGRNVAAWNFPSSGNSTIHRTRRKKRRRDLVAEGV